MALIAALRNLREEHARTIVPAQAPAAEALALERYGVQRRWRYPTYLAPPGRFGSIAGGAPVAGAE